MTLDDTASIRWGTSPLAWSSDYVAAWEQLHGGDISTCVELSLLRRPLRRSLQGHLHLRGAQKVSFLWRNIFVGTSPLAWSSVVQLASLYGTSGDISTCVEHRQPVTTNDMRTRGHLHLRGAQRRTGAEGRICAGTSPLAWSSVRGYYRKDGTYGDISTCVELRNTLMMAAQVIGGHLHLRGAQFRRNAGKVLH